MCDEGPRNQRKLDSTRTRYLRIVNITKTRSVGMFLSYFLYPFFLALGFANGRWASAEALRKLALSRTCTDVYFTFFFTYSVYRSFPDPVSVLVNAYAHAHCRLFPLRHPRSPPQRHPAPPTPPRPRCPMTRKASRPSEPV